MGSENRRLPANGGIVLIDVSFRRIDTQASTKRTLDSGCDGAEGAYWRPSKTQRCGMMIRVSVIRSRGKTQAGKGHTGARRRDNSLFV
jgi:hypothetical protein